MDGFSPHGPSPQTSTQGQHNTPTPIATLDASAPSTPSHPSPPRPSRSAISVFPISRPPPADFCQVSADRPQLQPGFDGHGHRECSRTEDALQLSHMAPARFPKPPASSRRDFAPTNGSDLPPTNGPAHNRIEGAVDAGLPPIREGKKTATPLGAPPILDLTQTNIAAPSPIKIPIKTPASSSIPLGASRPTHKVNVSIDRSLSRDGSSSYVRVATPDRTGSPAARSVDSSEDESNGPPRRFAPGVHPRLMSIRGRGAAPSPPPLASWRPPPQPGSFHSRHRYPPSYRQYTRSPSPESGSDYSGETTCDATSLSGEAERHNLWIRVTDLRVKTRQMRADLAEKRRVVQELRRKKDEVDNSFMQVLRPHLTSNKPLVVVPIDVIRGHFNDMQSIRDDYYSAESELEVLEARLEQMEAKLEHEESELTMAENRSLYDGVEDPRDQDSTSNPSDVDKGGPADKGGDLNSRYMLLGISGELQDGIHPLYQELLDAAGDRGLAREHYEEIRLRHSKILHDLEMALHRERSRTDPKNLLSEEELRSLKLPLSYIPKDTEEFKDRFGIVIDEDDLDFFRDYGREQQAVRATVEEATRRVDALRALCAKKGVMRKNPSYGEQFAISSESELAALMQEGSITLEEPARPINVTLALLHPRFPILLSNPSHVLQMLTPIAALEQAMRLPKDDPNVARRRAECMKELGISHLMTNAVSKPDYINQWLIHRLRTSPMEAELMLAISMRTLRIANLRRWQEDVLYFWRRDEAASLSPQDFRGPCTPRDELDIDDGSEFRVNSVAEASVRARSEGIDVHTRTKHHRRRLTGSLSIRSLS